MRGIRGFDKRKELFYEMRNNADIVCLQETHSTIECEQEWTNQWGGGQIVFAHGSSNARGVMICIKNKLNIEIIEKVSDPEGRYILLDFKLESCRFTLICLYAPNEDQPSFFESILKMSEKFDGYRIVAGDFNIALNPELDRTSQKLNNPNATMYVNEYIKDNNLIDLWRLRNPNRKHYSWRRSKPKQIGSRIDLLIVDIAIASWFTHICMKKSHKTDHLLLDSQIRIENNLRGPGLWRFNTRHLYNPAFIKKMNQAIDEQLEHVIVQKMKPDVAWEHIKLTLIYHANEFSRKIAAESNLIRNQLETEIDRLENLENISEGNQAILDRTHQDLEDLVTKKAQGAIFRSKAKWYNEGEHNTKYFFSLEKSRAGQKCINTLLDERGNEIRGNKKILNKMRQFYECLYTSDKKIKFQEENANNNVLNDEQKISLEGLITASEISKAVYELNNDKAPGIDGLPVEIYKVFWLKLKDPLIKALNWAYTENNELHKSAREGVISLIPKPNRDTRLIKNLRPITLLNTDYKILEKCLANRLKPILRFIINEDQKGFMSDRRIQTNIRRILDAVEFCDITDTPIAILSIDAEKAFDRVETDSLIAAMSYFNFGESFKKWTKICFTNATACVTNNGYVSDRFKVTRGVKQGGCCSAFYFLVFIETLANKLRNSDLQGLDIDGVAKLLGQYADDLDMYLWGSRQNVKKALGVIKNFEQSSGMKINVSKSTICQLGKQDEQILDHGLKAVNEINVLGVEVLSCIDDEKIIKINYENLINKATAILNQWKGRGLSLLGKVLVINTLIASLFVYKMSVLPIMPQKYLDKLNEIMNKFLWNNNKPKIKLEILQLPKDLGGAGLVDFGIKDLSLKFSWIQTIFTDSFLENNAKFFLHPRLGDQLWECNLHKDDIKYLKTKSKFWHDVLKAWCELNYTKFVPPDEVPYQLIWYNSHIRIDKNLFLLKNSLTKDYKRYCNY